MRFEVGLYGVCHTLDTPTPNYETLIVKVHLQKRLKQHLSTTLVEPRDRHVKCKWIATNCTAEVSVVKQAQALTCCLIMLTDISIKIIFGIPTFV